MERIITNKAQPSKPPSKSSEGETEAKILEGRLR